MCFLWRVDTCRRVRCPSGSRCVHLVFSRALQSFVAPWHRRVPLLQQFDLRPREAGVRSVRMQVLLQSSLENVPWIRGRLICRSCRWSWCSSDILQQQQKKRTSLSCVTEDIPGALSSSCFSLLFLIFIPAFSSSFLVFFSYSGTTSSKSLSGNTREARAKPRTTRTTPDQPGVRIYKESYSSLTKEWSLK